MTAHPNLGRAQETFAAARALESAAIRLRASVGNLHRCVGGETRQPGYSHSYPESAVVAAEEEVYERLNEYDFAADELTLSLVWLVRRVDERRANRESMSRAPGRAAAVPVPSAGPDPARAVGGDATRRAAPKSQRGGR